jgi:hypothetical protein
MSNKLPVPPLEKPEVAHLPIHPYHIAMVINNVVYDVLSVESKQAAQYLSQPKFIQISHREAEIGWLYDENTETFRFPPELDFPELEK